jgi:transposase
VYFFMTKYSYEQRLEAVLNVKEKHMSCVAAGKLLRCDDEVVRRWVKKYEQFGIKGLTLKHGKYTGEFKQHVVQYMHENHLSINETAIKLGIPSATSVREWEQIYYEEGLQALYRVNCGRKKDMSSDKAKKNELKENNNTNDDKEDLIAEVQRLRMENAYLKKLNALVQERIARENGKKLPPSEN